MPGRLESRSLACDRSVAIAAPFAAIIVTKTEAVEIKEILSLLLSPSGRWIFYSELNIRKDARLRIWHCLISRERQSKFELDEKCKLFIPVSLEQ